MPKSTEKKQNGLHATGGGSATQSGTDYQNRVAAWAAVSILAEGNATLRWNLPSHASFQYIRCETEQPVDDIMISTSDNGFIFIQAKHTINLQKGTNSELASVIKQFIRQFTAYRNIIGNQPWERSLNQTIDRLVLAIGKGSSLPVGENLKSVLNRLRNLNPGQSLESAAVNQDEQKAFSVICNHISSIWYSEYGVQPTDGKMRKLLSLIWVTTLDVDEDGSEEIEAKNLLKSSILQNNNEADIAWNTLIHVCADFARNRKGGDGNLLQQKLLNAGIDLKSLPSYWEDIERLIQYSKSIVNQLEDLSAIYVCKTKVKIDRKSTHALKTAAEKEPIVVVGEPGAGKSGALYDLVTSLQSEQFDVVFIAVDRIDAQSSGALRDEIGTSHEIIEILKNWIGSKPAFLVIDALDAARSEQAIQTFHALISDLIKSDTRWRVIVSIRKFDLRYNRKLQKLFLGTPPTIYIDTEFSKICHINIPNLDDSELKQIKNQSDILAKLALNSTTDLSQLLRNLFNLKLMGELIGLQMPLEELTSISQQDELLNLYWSERVICVDGQGDAREVVLRKITNVMVENRSLKINRSEIGETSTGMILDDLLSSMVITEWQASSTTLPDRYILTFAHHVLYDYAVSRLILRGTFEQFLWLLAKDPELVLTIRPSIVFHFRYIWLSDSTRQQFWNLVKVVTSNDEISEVGKIIGPGIASELAKSIDDFEPLFNMLKSKDFSIHQTAENSCRHLIGSLLSLPDNSYDKLVGNESGPWAELLEHLSSTMTNTTTNLVRPLLITLCDYPNAFTQQQEKLIGITARRLLKFAWDSPTRDNWLISNAIQAVCRTFKSDLKASAELILQSLEDAHIKLFGVDEMPALSGEVDKLITLDARLVENIYKAVFTNSEDSEEKTQIGGSRILGMTSTRKQDYDMVQYNLTEAFPEFLKTSPENATRALITIVKSSINKHHPISWELHEETFDFVGLKARIKTDYSSICDGNVYFHDDPLKMLDEFEKYLMESIQSDGMTVCRNEIIKIIAKDNSSAVMWKRLLQCGTKAINTIGLEIRSLAWAKPVLMCCDTTIDEGNFIKAIFGFLDKQERERVENTILSLADDGVADEKLELKEMDRNRFLGCLSEEYIMTDIARQIYRKLRDTRALPANEPGIRITDFSSQPYGEKEHLLRSGVLVEEKQNKLIQLIEMPIKEFNKVYLNSCPTVEAIQTLYPHLHNLYENLLNPDKNDVHPLQRDFAWGTLAMACERIASSDLSLMFDVGNFIKDVLLVAAKHPDPVHVPEDDCNFDEHPSWAPAPRINAAIGLMFLADNTDNLDRNVLAEIRILANDDVPAVRFHIANHLTALYKTGSDLMWELIENTCEREQSRGVLQGLLMGTFYRIAGENADQISLSTKKIFDRVTEGAGAKSVREACMRIFCKLYMLHDNQTAEEVIYNMVDSPKCYSKEVRYLVVCTRDLLTYGSANPSNQKHKAIRKKAFDIVEKILSLISEEINIENSKLKAGVELSTNEMDTLKSMIEIIDTISSTLYFASGALDEKHGHDKQNKKVLTIDEKKQFLFEADNLLNQLTDVGLFPQITHHLLETLETFIPLEPVIIFEKIGRIVISAQQGGYQYESLAADLIVKIIARYLAEYRWVFRNEKCQHMLLAILDIFVVAGWPSARRLIYRLDEIFR